MNIQAIETRRSIRKFKADAAYSVRRSDLAVPVLVAVACVLMTAFGGAVQTVLCTVVGSVIAICGMHCLAPMFWKACGK